MKAAQRTKKKVEVAAIDEEEVRKETRRPVTKAGDYRYWRLCYDSEVAKTLKLRALMYVNTAQHLPTIRVSHQG